MKVGAGAIFHNDSPFAVLLKEITGRGGGTPGYLFRRATNGQHGGGMLTILGWRDTCIYQ
jgi:hypothetical protein